MPSAGHQVAGRTNVTDIHQPDFDLSLSAASARLGVRPCILAARLGVVIESKRRQRWTYYRTADIDRLAKMALKTTPAHHAPWHWRTVSEGDLVVAIREWMSGGSWKSAEALWHPTHPSTAAVRLKEEGDRLTLDGKTVATRRPVMVPQDMARDEARHRQARRVARLAAQGGPIDYPGAVERARYPARSLNGWDEPRLKDGA